MGAALFCILPHRVAKYKPSLSSSIIGNHLILDLMPVVDIDKRMCHRVKSLKYDLNKT